VTKRRNDDQIPRLRLGRPPARSPTIPAHAHDRSQRRVRASVPGRDLGDALLLQRAQAARGRATQPRIAELCASAGHRVQRDEVAHIVAGDILQPHRRAQDVIRRAAILVDAVGQYGERREASTPKTCGRISTSPNTAATREPPLGRVRGSRAGTTSRSAPRLCEDLKTDPRMKEVSA
jgi:hypothetical protein